MNPSQPQTAAVDYNSINESLRRRMGSLPSGAGIPGGQVSANSPSPTNPIAQAGMASQPAAPAGAGFPSMDGSPMGGAMSAMKSAQPNEATLIVKALISRLNSSPPSGGAPNGQ